MSDFSEMLKEGPTLTFEPFKEEAKEPEPDTEAKALVAEEIPLTDEEKATFHACCEGIRTNMEHLKEL